MAKIVEHKLTWGASTSPDLAGYKIYWNDDGSQPDYLSPHHDCGNVLEILVADLANFPTVEGTYELGLTAYDTAGNESDMVYKNYFFDQTAPVSPTNFQIVVVG
jgi:hypothetical protein